MKKLLRKIFSVLLVILITTTLIQIPVFGNTDTTALEVLEVQPGTTFDLTDIDFSQTFNGRNVHLTQMSMPEFISKVDEINGQYDIVYIGNNTSHGAVYSALGTAPTTLPPSGLNNGTGTSKEFYSDNDITNRRTNTLKSFITSHQLTIFDESILANASTIKSTKLYLNFKEYKPNTEDSGDYPNFITVNTTDIDTETDRRSNRIKRAFSNYNNGIIAKRPSLTLNSEPVKYVGTDASYQTDKTLGYNFDIDNQSATNTMTVKLYIDINGDGIFKAVDDAAGKSELLYKMDNKTTGTGYTLNYHLPDSYVGLEPWKLEITDNVTGSKSYKTGATAFKVTNSSNELRVRVLQLIPDGNTLSINSLRNVSGQNLLTKASVYDIQVTEMKVSDFNNAHNQSTPATVTAKVNGVPTQNVPTVLNGNYDMVIMGFADIYGGNDLRNTNSINALQSFINTNQSVMFTHDTLTFDVNNAGSWGYNITRNFRDIVGQQRYYETPDSKQDPMPDSNKKSYGFTNLTLGRYNGSKLFQTTTKTHKVNDNLVTQFPFVLGDITVAPTHFQYFQLDLEDENVVPVYTLSNASGSTIYNHPGDGRNDYYTYTKGNITYSGTGHSSVGGIDEKKMFVNTMIKASRGANHAPTLDVNGISNGMNIANTLSSIDFNFTATDSDLNEPYLNSDIYLSTSTDGTNFGNYERKLSFSATDTDLEKRVKSGVAKSVNVVKTVDASIKAYRVKVEAYDSYGASVSQEITLNNVQEPQIRIESFTTSCLVGDTINIPVKVSSQATFLHETFKDISTQASLKNPSGVVTQLPLAQKTYADLIFSPAPSWNTQSQNYDCTFNSEGTNTIWNRLTYSAYIGDFPNFTGMQSRENDEIFTVQVGSGTLEVEVLDQKDRGVTGITTIVSGPHPGTATTNPSGLSSFTGLRSGNYTVTLTAPDGRSIVGSASQTVPLSASDPYQKVSFRLSGSLMTNPSITTQSGDSTISILKNTPIQTSIGLILNRSVTFLKLDLANSLSDGSTMNVAITNVFCNDAEISFDVDPGNQEKIIPEHPNTSLPRGSYKVYATITINGGTMQSGQSFTVSLTQLTSAMEESTGFEDNIDSVALPLNVYVKSAPKLH